MKDSFLVNWDEINKTTLDFLNCIPKEKFNVKPFDPRFKSFAWEFSCILTTRLGYIRGIKFGELDGTCFIENDDDFSKQSFEEILKKLNETGTIIEELIKSCPEKINYFGKKTEIFTVLSWLLQHEQFHYGKLLLYFAKAELELPLSLKNMWGENNF